ncbi:MAG: hypothetical protein U1C71_04660 [archaeon]|nr:hypothetical protein [archaeon]
MLLSGVQGQLYSGNDPNPIQTFSGTITIDLRPGDYRVEWETGGTAYRNRGVDYFTIDAGSKESGHVERGVFEQSIGVELLSLEFPSVMVAGQQDGRAQVVLTNTTNQAQTIELVFEEALALFVITTQSSPITIGPNTSESVTLLMNVPSTVPIKDTRSGDAKKARVRVKYTKSAKTADFTLFKSFDFSVSPSTNVAFTARANELVAKRYAIRNRGNADAGEKIQTLITIKGSPANDSGDITSWFSWSIDPPFGPLAKGETFSVDLRFNAPLTALNDTIEGEVTFSTSFWEQIVPFTISLSASKVEVVATVDGSTNKTFNLTQNSASGQWDSRTATLKVENKGELPIETILYTLDGCTEQHISLVDSSFFPIQNLNESGKTGSSKSTTLLVSAPATQLPDTETFCQIRLTFLDPKTGDISTVDPVLVRIAT